MSKSSIKDDDGDLPETMITWSGTRHIVGARKASGWGGRPWYVAKCSSPTTLHPSHQDRRELKRCVKCFPVAKHVGPDPRLAVLLADHFADGYAVDLLAALDAVDLLRGGKP